MGFLRSEDMGYYTLVMPHESAWIILNELGKVDGLQFVDLNEGETIFNRPYAGFVRRCEEAERRIKYIESEHRKFEVDIQENADVPSFLKDMEDLLRQRVSPPHTYFEELERMLEEVEETLVTQTTNYEKVLFNHE
jgi:V-type H+-transporting ATPase subunit a